MEKYVKNELNETDCFNTCTFVSVLTQCHVDYSKFLKSESRSTAQAISVWSGDRICVTHEQQLLFGGVVFLEQFY